MSHLTPHERICDAAIRMIHGLDDNDAAQLASAFTADATQDLTSFQFLAPYFDVLRGRGEIVRMVLDTVGAMDTTHMLSNFQTRLVKGKEQGEGAKQRAHLTCYALAQHWRPGQGRSHVFGNSFLMGNRYEGDLIFDGELWRFERFKIDVVWTQGDFGVFDSEGGDVVNNAVREGLEKAEGKQTR